ncbi:MAG: secretin N-terminal domain-containing protein [Planctomycetaceae bacterium]
MPNGWPKYLVLLLLLLSAAPFASPAQRASDTAEGDLRTYRVYHVGPAEVRRMLTDLLGASASSVQVIADSERGELIVRGDASVQKLASQLIKQVDIEDQSRPIEVPKILKRYSVGAERTDRIAGELRQMFGLDIRVTVDRKSQGLLVMATQNQHDTIRSIIAESSDSQPADFFNGSVFEDNSVFENKPRAAERLSADATALFPGSVVEAASNRPQSLAIPLRNITARQCQLAVQKLLGKQFQDEDGAGYRYVTSTGNVRIRFDSDDNICYVSGDAALAQQFGSLVKSLEQSQEASSQETFRFVPLRNVRPDVLREAIRTWKQTSAQGRMLNDGMQKPFQQSRDSFEQSAFARDNRIRPVGFSTQVQEQRQGDTTIPVQSDTKTADDLRRPSSDVTVEPLPDLDVLILRGRDPDVKELLQIIQEIERLSEETAPEIEVYHLRHVQGSALESLIEKVLNDLTEPLQGRISITPIIKPNALLLIGWGEAVNAAKRLIERLDRPVSPDSQMRVFELKYAPAAEVGESITGFLNGRGGLGPDVQITANPRTNSLIVNGSPRDLEEVEQLIEQLDTGASASINKARIIRLKNSLAADVAETLTAAIQAASGTGSGRAAALELMLDQPGGEKVVASGLLDSVKLTPDVRTNSIFITGPEESLTLVEQLIQQFDENPASSAQIKVFQISNGDATDLVSVLRSLFPEAATSTVPQLATADGESSTVPVRFSVDVRTNTIVATGTSGDLKIIEALLMRLDHTESQERVNRVYRLKNSPANDVAQAVNDFLRSERIVTQAAPGRENPFAQIEQEVVVVPEPVRNSLIISATPRYFEQILELVEDLDDQPPQVMIQVILAEIDLDNFHEFGVELGLQDSLLFDRSLLGDLLSTTVTSSTSTPAGVVTTTQQQILGASNTPGFDFNNNPLGNSGSTQSLSSAGNVAGQALSHFSLGRMNSDLEYGGLVLSASSENVSVLLRALDQSGSMEVLSRPQIMTLDNQQAFIQVGQRVPRIVNSQLTQLGQINSLSLEDVGLLLGVTPRISPDGMVVMEIDAEKSDVGDERDGIPISVSNDGTVIRSPRVNVTTAQTTVSAASGQTIVIGGLITNSNKSLSRKVPWLGDLPLLGNLFRYDGYTNRRTELLIILTPQVILGQSEAEYLKQVEMSRMSWVSSDVFEWMSAPQLDRQMLDDDGIPVIFPDESPTVPAIELAPLPEAELQPGGRPNNDIVFPPYSDDASGFEFDRDASKQGTNPGLTPVTNAGYEASTNRDTGIAPAAAKNSGKISNETTSDFDRSTEKPRKKGFLKWFGGNQ